MFVLYGKCARAKTDVIKTVMGTASLELVSGKLSCDGLPVSNMIELW